MYGSCSWVCLHLLDTLGVQGGFRCLQVGRLRTELQQEFPGYNFDLVGDGIWWHSGGSTDPKHIALQGNGVLCLLRLRACWH